MGKVKSLMTEEDRLEFYVELCYQEWVMENAREAKEKELNRLAKEYLQPYVLENFLLCVGSVNNIDY